MEMTTGPEILIGILPLLFLLFAGTLSLAFFAFWIWMLIDCLQYEEDKDNQKLVWALVIIFTNWLGALIYYFVRRKERTQSRTFPLRP